MPKCLAKSGSVIKFVIKTWQSKLKQKSSDMQAEGFFVPENVVPKVRVELTRVAPLVFETSASTIPPLRHRVIL